MMKSMLWLRGVLALAVTSVASMAIAADHRDGPDVSMDPTADINDVYSWVDGDNVILVMTVFPQAMADSAFSPNVQYVFHTASHAAFGAPGTGVDIICTFDDQQVAQCWAGADEYVTGDASDAAGITSASTNFKVFAGLRDDPFFFNLNGFNAAVSAVVAAAPTLTFDAAGCPAVDAATSTALVTALQSDPDNPGGPALDFFAGFNTLAIVVSVNKSLLVTDEAPILSVWGSTNQAGG
jgi:Domain of unknown function (DUF4331)